MRLTNSMRVYWIAFDFGHGDLEMIDGPFGTMGIAHNERIKLLGNSKDDEKLVIVVEYKEVVIV